jgi:peptidyl-prolyl cis-trans isomerase SurA
MNFFSPDRPHPGTEFPCPILATSFRREGGKAQRFVVPEPVRPTLPGCPIFTKASSRKGGPAQTIILTVLVFFLSNVLLQAQPPVVLDRVVAVVNNQAILLSDLDDEVRLSVLDPGRGGMGILTRTRALDQLIGRALIEQQIHEQDAEAAEPTQAELDARLASLRNQLPTCVRENCASDTGWQTFLAAHDLNQDRVKTYLRHRIEILRFIELRFRQGVNISPQDVETYYRDTLIPQYPKGDKPPALDQVSKRIEEILLQQRVNVLFDDWLNNLRRQGEIEVLDPSLEAPAVASPEDLAPEATEKPSAPGGIR